MFSQEHITRILKLATVLVFSAALLMVGRFLSDMRAYRYIGLDVPPQATISVSGQGEVYAVPDVAEFTASVLEEGKTVSEAQDKATEKMNAVISYLKDSDIDEKDIKTLGYNIQPKYEWQRSTGVSTDIYYPSGRQVLVGYTVSQDVRVKVRDTAKAGDLLAGVGGKEVSNVSGLTFTFDDPDALEREARQKAIADAQTKAKELASDLNVSLVRVISYNENGVAPVYRAVALDAAVGLGASEAKVSPEIPIGENKLTSNVTIFYEIR